MTNEDMDRLLASYEPRIAELARLVCDRIQELLPDDAVVTVDEHHIGFGTDSGYKGLIFTVAPTSRHVTVHISHAAELPDPAGLLEGAGKVHRHVKIRQATDLDRPELRDVMTQAIARHVQPGCGTS